MFLQKRGRWSRQDESQQRLESDGHGLPIGLHVASAQPHELTLAEPTLNTIRVPQKHGRPKIRPKELVAEKPTTLLTFAASCGNAVLNPPSQLLSVASLKPLSGVIHAESESITATAGKLSAVSPGWITVVVWWSVMTVISIFTGRFACLLSRFGVLTEF